MQVVRAGAPAHLSANDKVMKRVACVQGSVWVENQDGRTDLKAGDHVLLDVDSMVLSLTHAYVVVSEVDGFQERLRRLEER